MKRSWDRHLWIVVFGIVTVGLFAARLISFGSLGEIGIGFHLLGDSFAAAQIDLVHKGFQCGKLQSSPGRTPVQALACERTNAPLSPSEDRVYRLEMAGSGNKIAHVTTRFCGSESRPCPTPPAVITSPANNPVAPMAIPPPDQPAPPSVTAAFSILCLIASTAWCVDWRHYVRFLLGPTPNYEGNWVRGLRIFYAFSLLTALRSLGRIVFTHSWTFQDYKYTTFWAFIVVAAFATLDGIFRFKMGRPKVVKSEAL